MGLDRESIPDTYLCEICEPRPFDREGAKALQMRKRTELNIDTSETDSSDEIPDQSGKSGNEAGKKGKWQKEKKLARWRSISGCRNARLKLNATNIS